MKVIILSKLIIIFSVFFSNISSSNEEFSDVCTFQSSTIEKNEKKCIYKCNNKLKFLFINKKINCYSDLKMIGKSYFKYENNFSGLFNELDYLLL